MTTAAGHVFISHGSDNRDEANAISAFLEGRGIRTWIAPRDVRPGMDYSEQLQEAIETCVAFVVLVTDMANKSPYVRAETEMAFSTGKPIFPIRESDIKPASGLAFFLKIRHWTDAYGDDADASMDRLVRELRGLSGLPADAAAEPGAAPKPAPPPTPAPSPPPHPGSAVPPPQASPAGDEALLRAAAGPRADYYLGRWRQMGEKGSAISWNWAACLASLYWFAYRKMWMWMAAIAFAFVLLAALGAGNPIVGRITLFLSIGLTFVTGAFGNHLYRKQIDRLVAGTAGLDRTEAVARLEKRGGVSMAALGAAIAVTLVLVALAVALAARQMRADMPASQGPSAAATSPPADAAPPPGGATASSFDPAALVGRWADVGDCANAVAFTDDGRFVAPDGGGGTWNLQGDQLTLSGPGGTETVQVTSLDQSAMYVVNSDGSVATSQRC